MSANPEIYHVDEDFLRGLWEMVHEEHRGPSIENERLCTKATCLGFRGMLNGSTICGGEGNDDD